MAVEAEAEEESESGVVMLGRSIERRMLRREEALVRSGPLFDGARLLSSSFTVSSFCASCTHVFPLCRQSRAHTHRKSSAHRSAYVERASRRGVWRT
jgi:hypothetical protein